jgi:hypothetical protein
MFLECNELLDHIASTHGPTLETLRIPILKPNARNLHNIIAGGKRLRELWFFVNQNLKVFSIFISRSLNVDLNSHGFLNKFECLQA